MNKTARNVLIVIVLLAFVILGAYLVASRQPRPQPAPPKPSAEAPAQTPKKVKVYRITVEGNEAKLAPTEKEVPPGKDPAEIALRRLVEQGDSSDLANPIPSGTRLLGFKVENGLATVNLSKEFRDNFAGGSDAEALTIGSILRTLSQFSEIKKVQIEVEGKPLDTLGHLDLSGPLDVNWTGWQFGDGS